MTDIPEEEQWRLINKSGVLKKLKTAPEPRMEDMKTLDPLAEEILNATLYIIPISFLLLLMEMCVFIVVLSQLLIAMSSLIHFQYGKHPTLNTLVDRMVPGVPIISLFVFYTTRYKSYRKTQVFLFFLGIFSGSRMLYLLNRGSWLVNMKQCPPLATAWVYAIVQLELSPAVVSLGVVGIYVWWQGLSLRP
ncbi:hypothetical protein H2248_006257 [Termitomyces sp. 'cryptogamus']|nr:hypothetical protein H2248_006257 [Termitomyces sp. 'cryptogamus']